MSTEQVSVIIPTYDRADCVTRAIDSALAQTHADVEVIVVDDGSTDDTAALVRDTYAGEPRVRYTRQENRGVSAARNRGIRLARGAYMALLDSDDAWEPFKLELQLACLDAFPDAGMVWTDMKAVGPAGEVVSEHHLRRFYSALTRPKYDLESACRASRGSWASARRPGCRRRRGNGCARCTGGSRSGSTDAAMTRCPPLPQKRRGSEEQHRLTKPKRSLLPARGTSGYSTLCSGTRFAMIPPGPLASDLTALAASMP